MRSGQELLIGSSARPELVAYEQLISIASKDLPTSGFQVIGLLQAAIQVRDQVPHPPLSPAQIR